MWKPGPSVTPNGCRRARSAARPAQKPRPSVAPPANRRANRLAARAREREQHLATRRAGGAGTAAASIAAVLATPCQNTYTPNGKAIQDTAITPNIVVADNADDFVLPDEDENNPAEPDKKERTPQNDDQLKRAIQVLETQGKKA